MRTGSKKRARPTRFLFKIKERVPTYLKQEVSVNFTPHNQTGPSIFPCFNTDRRHYTAAFTLPAIEPQDPRTQETEHDRRVREIEMSNTELLQPKPRSRHKYCAVCRVHYEDYKEHIEGEAHASKVRASPFHALILEECARCEEQRAVVGSRDGENRSGDTVESSTQFQLFKCLDIDPPAKTASSMMLGMM